MGFQKILDHFLRYSLLSTESSKFDFKVWNIIFENKLNLIYIFINEIFSIVLISVSYFLPLTNSSVIWHIFDSLFSAILKKSDSRAFKIFINMNTMSETLSDSDWLIPIGWTLLQERFEPFLSTQKKSWRKIFHYFMKHPNYREIILNTRFYLNSTAKNPYW